ncbi:MAG: sulfotransferase domain-containing protein [Desulfobacterales bacterium]|nr:sulfotransferase domain-containing protein [Desulfobacterales bacterium]
MKRLHLITSTGRTGTQFFEYFINSNTVDAVCKHEPRPSRRFKLYSNLYLDGKISKDFIARQYCQARSRLWEKMKCPNYVESSNFLFGCIPALRRIAVDLKIVHVVREPKAYILSHLNHRFWQGRKKIVAKYLPYWREPFDLDPHDRNNPIRILADRWVFVNETIGRYTDRGNCMRVKFEELFSPDQSIACNTISAVADFLELTINDHTKTAALLREKKNVSPKRYRDGDITPADEVYIQEKCKKMNQLYEFDRFD